MQKTHLDCFYVIKNLDQHEQIKQSLLSKINQADYKPCIDTECETNITKTDWHLSKDFTRPWVQFLNQYLLDEMLEIYKSVGYDGFTLHEIWFQQYAQSSSHGWHTHSSNFTSVYYLDLPDDAPKTQLVHPYDQKNIITLNVEEGDIVVFPSFVLHRAPPNKAQDLKTIISYNTNITYSNEIYAQGLEHAIF